MKCQILFSGKNKKDINNLSSAELVSRGKVLENGTLYLRQPCQNIFCLPFKNMSPLRIDPFSDGSCSCCAGNQTGSHQSCSLVKSVENRPSVSNSFKKDMRARTSECGRYNMLNSKGPDLPACVSHAAECSYHQYVCYSDNWFWKPTTKDINELSTCVDNLSLRL